MAEILKCLAPKDLGTFEPGKPVRLPDESREIPTIRHPYGDVPLLHVSASIRRIITLAYLLLWEWEEHKINSSLIHQKPLRKMVVFVDEVEAHLHPQWQRSILPALSRIPAILDDNLDIQFFVTTHSPLVMASLEPYFSRDTDTLFHLTLDEKGNIELNDIPFFPNGPVDQWLMSETFQLLHARSKEAEEAIEDAKRLQLEDNPDKEKIESVNERLKQFLAENDRFWPRWVYFAEQKGVKV